MQADFSKFCDMSRKTDSHIYDNGQDWSLGWYVAAEALFLGRNLRWIVGVMGEIRSRDGERKLS